MILDGVVQGEEFDTLFLGMLNLLETGRHLLLTATVGNEYTLGTQTLGCTAAVHSGVTATHNHYVLAATDGSVIVGTGSIHQVDTGQVLVGRHDAVAVLTGNTHEVGQTGT